MSWDFSFLKVSEEDTTQYYMMGGAAVGFAFPYLTGKGLATSLIGSWAGYLTGFIAHDLFIDELGVNKFDVKEL